MNRMIVEALDHCLQALQAGSTFEEALAQYPGLTEELRPLLVLALKEQMRGLAPVPENSSTRSRVRVLAAASRLREKPHPRVDRPVVRRMAVSLAVVVFLLAGGSGLLSASASSLPGELLYPVKRTVEDLRLRLTIDQEKKVQIEHQLYDLRIDETDTLLEENRVVRVDFDGILEEQTENGWIVSGIPVWINAQTEVEGVLLPGVQVEVRGVTQTDGLVLVEQIKVDEIQPSGEDRSSSGEQDETPEDSEDDLVDPSETPDPESGEDSHSEDDESTPDPTEDEDD
jgi:hypothetical protein